MTTSTDSSTAAACAARDRLPLGPDLDLAHAAALREELLARAMRGDLHLDLGGVSRCDLAGLQLLVAARASARANQQLCTLHTLSGAVRSAGATFGIDLESTDQP
ncbi:MAG: STAS domain-containing protein [Planctomycetes bacterium]|jgi:anti-anti-sigma regulatory factor|nr:STAS domain-containing protein [Planctomycetota bacterium]